MRQFPRYTYSITLHAGGLSQYVSAAQDIVRTCSFLKKCALSEDVLLQPRLKSKLCMLRSAPAVLPPRLFAGEDRREMCCWDRLVLKLCSKAVFTDSLVFSV